MRSLEHSSGVPRPCNSVLPRVVVSLVCEICVNRCAYGVRLCAPVCCVHVVFVVVAVVVVAVVFDGGGGGGGGGVARVVAVSHVFLP